MTGGIMVTDRKIDLYSGRELVITDDRTGKQDYRELDATEIRHVAGLIPKNPGDPVKPASTCADCFKYLLTIKKNGQKLPQPERSHASFIRIQGSGGRNIDFEQVDLSAIGHGFPCSTVTFQYQDP